MLTKHNRIDEAISVSKRVVELNPRHTGERRRLARRLMRAGRIEEARDQLLQGLAFSGDQWDTHLLLSRVYRKLGDVSAALNAVRRAAELAPDEPSVRRPARKRTSLLKKGQKHFKEGRKRFALALKWLKLL